MSFRNLRNLEYKPGNETAPTFSHLPSTILEALIPGYSFISKVLLDIIGFDVSLIVSVLVLLVALTTGVQYLSRYLTTHFARYCTASVTIDAYDSIYDHVMAWAAEQDALRRVRSLRVQSADEGATDEIDPLQAEPHLAPGAIFNFNHWAAKVPPRYEPHTGMHWFWHQGHYFKFEREMPRLTGGLNNLMPADQEKLTLTVLGRSTQPIKDLILETRDRHLSHQTAKTVVRRPSPKEQRGRGRQAWTKVAVRPSRPMSTVVLDDVQKSRILEDINEFLHPATPRWYANRGIPYRRGYLFHGPPGTGKTSLSFALAGVFGLDIYCLSLSEATLTEEDLILLFNSLPKRCVVLLEDIDSAGVLRKKTDAEDEPAPDPPRRRGARGKKDDGSQATTSEAASTIAKEVARAVRNANDASEAGRKGPSLNNQGITISGLLNAIDGVASQEGRVLVMTTNYPEKLDEALIRPGRVDLKIEFALASKQQIRELFRRMYCADATESARRPTQISHILPAATTGSQVKEEAPCPPETNGHVEKEKELSTSAARLLSPSRFQRARLVPPTPPMTPTTRTSPSRPSSVGRESPSSMPSNPSSWSPEQVEQLASAFAAALPDGAFSPAEVQGFLLTRKKEPWRALVEVPRWVEEELRRKKAGIKVGTTAATGPVAPATREEHGQKPRTGRTRHEQSESLPLEGTSIETGSKSLLGTGEAAAGEEEEEDDNSQSSEASEASEVSVASSAESVASVSTVG